MDKLEKPLKLLFASLLLTAAATAAPILTCGSDLIPNGSGVGAPILCPTVGDPGNIITAISLILETDYTGYESGDPAVKIDYLIGGPVSFTHVPEQQVITIPGSDPVNSLPVFAFSLSILNPGPISGIFVVPTGSISDGAVSGSSAVVALTYTETVSGVPEPDTWVVCLLGAGVLFIFAKKRA